MLKLVSGSNRTMLDQIIRLASCDEAWRARVHQEFSLTAEQLDHIEKSAKSANCRDQLMDKATHAGSLFTVNCRDLTLALARTKDTPPHKLTTNMSNEYQMAATQFAAALSSASRTNPSMTSVRFQLSQECVALISTIDSYDLSNALIYGDVKFRPTTTLDAAFSCENNVERKRCILRALGDLMKINKIYGSSACR